ncbi:hypothetical protein RUM44_007850 [Polyplax serrata]|uniref:Uncharacterized protein n=1 Tax=Polyplax serrata TaxID=468196 RepID=A0ABR1B7B4_POLSC
MKLPNDCQRKKWNRQEDCLTKSEASKKVQEEEEEEEEEEEQEQDKLLEFYNLNLTLPPVSHLISHILRINLPHENMCLGGCERWQQKSRYFNEFTCTVPPLPSTH